MARSPLEPLVRSFASSYPADVAHSLEGLDPAEAGHVLERLPARIAGSVLERIAPSSAAAILRSLTESDRRSILSGVSSRQAASILRLLEDAAREATLTGLDPDRSAQIRSLLDYSPDTAGGMMDPRITSLRVDLTASQAISALRRAPRQTLYYLYVTDLDGRLVGVLNMRDLLLARASDPISEMIRRDVVTIPSTLTRPEVMALIRERRFVAVPVVDSEGHLLGVVKPDEILEAMGQQAFGDLQKMVGAGGDERALSPVSVVVRKRLPWLYVNLMTAFVAAAVVGIFEGTIEKVTALAVLLPVVAGQGGNTGAQSLAIVMRGIALQELTPGSTRRLLAKETLGALLNGAAIALGTGIAVLLWDGRVALMLVIGLAMVVNMTAAGLAGAAIPLILQRLGRDPAQSSAIFLTTVTDVVGFAAFLGFAAAFMGYLT